MIKDNNYYLQKALKEIDINFILFTRYTNRGVS